jgi:hypothetical protein
MRKARSRFVLLASVSTVWLALARPANANPGERFQPASTAASDYRALRDIARIVLQPASRATLETEGQPMCAIERSGRIVCAGGGALGTRRRAPPASSSFETPCFGAAGVFDGPGGDPLVALNLLNLENGLCAIGQSGRVYCASAATAPLLAWADRDAPKSRNTRPRAIALTRSAALYDDMTLRLRDERRARFGPSLAIVGVPARPVAMTETEGPLQTGAGLCLLTDSHQVYCALGTSASPVRFTPVAAPHDAHMPGPTAACDAEACGGPLTEVLELAAAGTSHTCALVAGGEVVCWESPGDRPWRLPRFTDPVSIAVSGLGVCAVTRAGGVECLGVDWAGHTITEPLSAVPGLSEVDSIATHGDGLCAITLAGRVDCRMVPARSPSEPLTSDEDDLYAAPPPDEWYADETQPAVAILGWTRDIEDLVFAGTSTHFNTSTTPLIGVTTDGRLLGMRPTADFEERGPLAFVRGLPCLSVDGRAFCRRHEGFRWGPWEPADTMTQAGAAPLGQSPPGPWWLSLPSGVDSLVADLEGVPELLEKSGLSALELVGWDGTPCLRVDDGTVRCVRRMGARVELVPVPAARYDRHDLCAAFVDGPGADDEPLRGVVDIDGSHGTACALLENRDIACWGQLDRLPHGANRKSRRYAPRIVARIQGAVEIAVTSDFVCARVEPSGKVRCLGSAGLGRAPGRWGGFGDSPVDLVGLDGVSRLTSLPDRPVACAWSQRARGAATHARSPSAERRDPQTDPEGALRAALNEGRAVCWGDEDALHNLNATFLGSPVFLTPL